ncbi:MAG: isocitrate dehydrogenase, NADP-dependent, prokaryotic type, partial [Acidobacteria bacterium]|nr:isocitrate dehydrogenase, NADP-dependent, prokaryotic type [Acidobacteriota bacterium]
MTEPQSGTRIDFRDGKLVVPDDPIVPFIEGDGTGPDIWRATKYVLDGTVDKVYGGKKKFHWYEVLAGDKAFAATGEYLPQATLDAIRDYRV